MYEWDIFEQMCEDLSGIIEQTDVLSNNKEELEDLNFQSTEVGAQIEKLQNTLAEVIAKEDIEISHVSLHEKLRLRVWAWGLEIKKENEKLKLTVERQKAEIKALKNCGMKREDCDELKLMVEKLKTKNETLKQSAIKKKEADNLQVKLNTARAEVTMSQEDDIQKEPEDRVIHLQAARVEITSLQKLLNDMIKLMGEAKGSSAGEDIGSPAAKKKTKKKKKAVERVSEDYMVHLHDYERSDVLREMKKIFMKREGLHLRSFSKKGDPALLMQKFVAVLSHNGNGQVIVEVALPEEIDDLISDELGAQLERLEAKFNNGLSELEDDFIREHEKLTREHQRALKAQHRELEPLFKVGQDIRLRMLELQRPLNKQRQGIVERGNSAAHYGNVLSDASLFGNDDAGRVPDAEDFAKLYSFSPATVKKFQKAENFIEILNWRGGMVNFLRKGFDGSDFDQAFRVVEGLVTKEIETTRGFAAEHLEEVLGACRDSIRTMRRNFMHYYGLHIQNRGSSKLRRISSPNEKSKQRHENPLTLRKSI